MHLNLNISRIAPLVDIKKYNPFYASIDHTFKFLQKDIIYSNRLAYDVGILFHSKEIKKNKTLFSKALNQLASLQYFLEKQATIKPIFGLSGIRSRSETEDCPGIIIYFKAINVAIVTFRGSITRADWSTNMNAQTCDALTQECSIGYAKVHQGFSDKILSLKQSLFETMDSLIRDKKEVQFFLTGHSQGAALAHLTSLLIIYYLKTLQNYDNCLQNQVKIFRLASPKTAGNELSKKLLEAYIGKHNDITQNILADPMINNPIEQVESKILQNFLKSFDSPMKKYLGYHQCGTLALQPNPSKSLPFLKYKCAAHFLDAKFKFDPNLVQMDIEKFIEAGYEYEREYQKDFLNLTNPKI